MRKKLFTIALSAIMVIAMAVPAFAAPNDIVISHAFADTSHPTAFFTEQNTNSNVINIFSSADALPGMKLTTWSYTEHLKTQAFEKGIFTANGITGNTWATYENSNVVINCKRVGSTPEVDLAYAMGNYRADIEIAYTRSTATTLGVSPRYIHNTDLYITLGGKMSGGNYLNWTKSGTVFYQYDMGLGIWTQ